MKYRLVWPPDTTRTTAGKGISPCSSPMDSMCPARWCTATTGRPRAAAAALANATPTRSAPIRPGPRVTAIASTPDQSTAASASARSTTPQMSRTCWREAISGTMPPHSRWMAVWDAITFDRSTHGRATSPVVDTTAAAVSSHDVSIPRTFICARLGRRLGSRAGLEEHLQTLGIGRPSHTALRDDAGHEPMRRHVKGGVPHRGPIGREPRGTQMRHLFRVAFFDWNLAAVGRPEVDGREGRRHVERHAVRLGEDRHGVRPDLVRDVAIRRDAVRADDNEVDLAALHQRPGHALGDDGRRNPVAHEFPGRQAGA